VVAVVDPAIAEESADITAVLADGRREHVFVEHAIGSLRRPMSDAELQAKFDRLVTPVLGEGRAHELVAACRSLADAADLSQVLALACA